MPTKSPPVTLRFDPLTPDRWADLAALFGPRGAFAGCWCMWWRQTPAEYAGGGGAPAISRPSGHW